MHVPKLGLGCAPLANLYQTIPDAQAQALIEFALAHGVNFFDTAPLYGAGLSEQRLGRVLSQVPRDSFILASKVGRLVQPDGSMSLDFSRAGVLRSLEESLSRLKLDRIDIVHIHDPEDLTEQAIQEAFPALAELRAQGVIKAIGVGSRLWRIQMDFAARTEMDCFLLAGRYTLLEQQARPLLETCLPKHIPIFMAGVYNSGILATGPIQGAKYDYADAPEYLMERARQLQALCDGYGVPLRTAAAQFPLRHPAITSVIIGAQSAAEFAQTIESVNAPLPPAWWQDVDALHATWPADET